MSAWKLVEAVAEAETNEVSNAEAASAAGRGGRGRGEGRGRGSSSSTGRGRGGRGGRFNGNVRTKADRSYFSYLAVQQIDLIFSPDSLCMDTYVRGYMDEAGYVPVALACSYYNVACYGCSYYDIVNKLKEVSTRCKFIELDSENETIRLKEGWEKFVMPNGYGGRGLPRYIKQPVYFDEGQQGEGDGQGEAQLTAEEGPGLDMEVHPTKSIDEDPTAMAEG